jgi:hypothetical protein
MLMLVEYRLQNLIQEIQMINEYQSIEGLIDKVKGTTGFLASLFSLKLGSVFLFVVFAAIIAYMLF